MLDSTRAIDIVTTALLRDIADDVDLIFTFGSRLKGSTHAYSDLDIAYVPREGTPYHAITVVVADTLIDLFPIPWSWLERMATYESIVGTAIMRTEIIYRRDDETAERFHAVVQRRRALQQPEARPDMVRRAMSIFQGAGYQYYLLREAAAADHRLACFVHARRILDTVLHTLGVANQVDLDTRRLDAVLALPRLPDDLAGLVAQVTTATEPEEMVAASEALLGATRRFLLAEQRQALQREASYAEVLAGAYPELKGDLQHVLLAAERRDWFDFKLWSFYHELMVHMAEAETGVSYSDFNSLMDYEQDLARWGFPDLVAPVVARDFAALHEAVQAFDRRLRSFLGERDVALQSFDTLDDLQAYLGL